MATEARLLILLIVVKVSTSELKDNSKFEYLDRYLDRNEPSMGSTFKIPTYETHDGSEISRADFEYIIRRGIPSVFKGVARQEDKLRRLSCSDFSNRWPQASMRAEYTGKPEGETFLKLGDQRWVNETRSPIGMNAPTEDCDDEVSRDSRPHAAPFVWHVKDRVARSIKSEISQMFKGLPFLEPGSLLDQHTRDSMEFWFQQVGAGTFAHNDGYCHSVFSVQLRGKKKWRLMLAPQVEKLSRDVFDEFDSGIYKSVHKWEPDVEVVLNEGDGILFPPGYMHETRTVDGPTDTDRCATSVTFNVPLPMPSRFIREFMSRFSVSREIHQCMNRWESFVTARADPVEWEKPVEGNPQPRTVAEDIFARIDVDQNGQLTIGEISDYFTSENEETLKFRKRKSVEFGDMTFVFDPTRKPTEDMFLEAFQVRAKDTLDMWDLNEDGFADFDEVMKVVECFQFYKWRQELVDTALSYNGVDLPIGSEVFTKRLEIVEKIMEQIRRNPPSFRTRVTASNEEL
jgi:hypothetical protein